MKGKICLQETESIKCGSKQINIKDCSLVDSLVQIQQSPMEWGFSKWSRRELNPRHKDFQSFALPTELLDLLVSNFPLPLGGTDNKNR